MSFYLAGEGPPIRSERDAVDLIAEAGASTVVLPIERLDEEFFRLRSGLAGAIFQKFVNYGVRLIIVGDVSRYTDESEAFRGLVYETNRGQHVWFVPTLEAAKQRIR